MKRPALFLFLSLFAFPAFAAGTDTTSFCGLRLGLTRAEILSRVETEPPLRGAEVVKDSNTFILLSPSDTIPDCGPNRLVSVKCLFNKKPALQALSFTFAARTTDEVDAVYRWALLRLGKPKLLSTASVGFSSEAEWARKGERAFFFASDVDFEAYLLLGTAGFVKEEDLRGTRSQE